MLQIIGTKRCKETAKALRACKERSIPHQFVNLAQRSLSEGEWASLFSSLSDEDLLDTNSAFYRKEGYSYRAFSIREELMEHPELLKTPVLRIKGKAHAGFDLAKLIEWGAL